MFRSTAILSAVAAACFTLSAPTSASAQERYLGEIFMGGWNFCPRGSSEAAGQLLAISQNSALFALFGTQYGGDGRTTFALPDLRGRVAINQGQGPGLSPYQQGQRGGAERRTLTTGQMPSHSHTASALQMATTSPGISNLPTDKYLADDGRDRIYSNSPPNVNMGAGAVDVSIANTGGNQPFDIIQPYTVIRFCVATVGIFPSRN